MLSLIFFRTFLLDIISFIGFKNFSLQEALFERANLLQIAPHLSSALPIMLPIYK
uniref:Uncharacterized protein n=1 Tax=Heterorhabditis bacteriophora TaxID=37862 RepID=A0A1I7WTE7_HETBA